MKKGAPKPGQRILCTKDPETECLEDRVRMERAGGTLSTVSEHIALEPIRSDTGCLLQRVLIRNCLVRGVETERTHSSATLNSPRNASRSVVLNHS